MIISGSCVVVAITAPGGYAIGVCPESAADVANWRWAANVATFCGTGVGKMTIGVTAPLGTGVNVPVVTATAVASCASAAAVAALAGVAV
jgi:hypothetical protein